jgi:hypothetical protein
MEKAHACQKGIIKICAKNARGLGIFHKKGNKEEA